MPSLIRALRYRGDEVQLGRALHSVCVDDDVARAFVAGLLGVAADGSLGTRARRLLARLPSQVTCSEQTHLFAEVGRHALRRRIERVGVVDLDFKGSSGWRLIVELKIDAPFGSTQRPRYLATKHPLVAVVRDASLAERDGPGSEGDNWLGAVAWEALVPVLRSLPIASNQAAAQWNELLDIALDDGDLTRKRARQTKTGKEAAEVLARSWPDLQTAFVQAVESKHGKRAASALQAAIDVQSGGGSDGAGVGIAAPAGEARMIWIALSEPRSTAPTLTVSWFAPPGRRAKRQLAAAHDRLEKYGFEQRMEGQWTRQYALPSSDVRDLGLVGAVSRHVGHNLRDMARTGVLEVDVLDLRDASR